MRVVELAGIGPAPFCAMVLADLGAEILRLDRPDAVAAARPDLARFDVLNRGRRSVGVDLKHAEGAPLVLRLVERADVLVEGFRPGVAERLGVGPDTCFERNRRLVYGRMTGWGQDGPLAARAGHDIDYIAVAGALGAIGRRGQPPTPPLNLVGDFGGGGLLLAFGIACALLHASRSGQGQVVDAAMVDGAALLMSPLFGARAHGFWSLERGTNLLDSGAPFYDVYPAADGEWLAVGAIEPAFYAELLVGLGLDAGELPEQMNRDRWPELRERLAAAFRRHPRDHWLEVFAGTDACVAPVLTLDEVADHPHVRHRRTLVEVAGVAQPAPAPRFSATPASPPAPPPAAGDQTGSALLDWGFDDDEVAELRQRGAVAGPPSVG